MSPHIIHSFYTCTVESILTGCITAWCGNSTSSNQQPAVPTLGTDTHTAHLSVHTIHGALLTPTHFFFSLPTGHKCSMHCNLTQQYSANICIPTTTSTTNLCIFVLCLYILYFIALYSVYTAYKSKLLFVKCPNVYNVIC